MNEADNQRLVDLGIEPSVIQQAQIEDDRVDLLIKHVEILRNPTALQGPSEPVKIQYPWQLELIAGQLDPVRLPKEVANTPIADWTDNAGLSIFHYLALSGDPDAIQHGLVRFPQNCPDKITFEVSGEEEEIQEIAARYPSYDKLTQPDGKIIGFKNLTSEQSSQLAGKYDAVMRNANRKLLIDKRQNTLAHYMALSQNTKGLRYTAINNAYLLKRMWVGNDQNQKPLTNGLKQLFDALLQKISNPDPTTDQAEIITAILLLSEFVVAPPQSTDTAQIALHDIGIIATQRDQLGVLEVLKDLRPNLLTQKDSNGKTILHHAVALQKWEVVRYIFTEVPELIPKLWVPDKEGNLPEDCVAALIAQTLMMYKYEAIEDVRETIQHRRRIEAKEVDLLVALKAIGQYQQGINIADLIKIKGLAPCYFRLFLERSPMLIRDAYHGEIPSTYRVLLDMRMQWAAKAMYSGVMRKEDVDLLVAFKTDWKVYVNDTDGHLDITTIDCTHLTRSKLMHVWLLSQSPANRQSPLLARLEEFITQLDQDELTENQFRCLKVLMSDQESLILGAPHLALSTLFEKLKESRDIQRLQEKEIPIQVIDSHDFQNLQGPVKSPQNLLEKYIKYEYVPYVTTMTSSNSDNPVDSIERAADFIMRRHEGTVCQFDKDFAPNSKIEKEYVKRYLEQVRVIWVRMSGTKLRKNKSYSSSRYY